MTHPGRIERKYSSHDSGKLIPVLSSKTGRDWRPKRSSVSCSPRPSCCREHDHPSGDDLLDALFGDDGVLSRLEIAFGLIAASAVIGYILMQKHALVLALV